jgi:hypothetical protein
VYTANFGGKPPAGNIIDIPTEDIPEFDLLTAGFPCQVLIVPILLLVIATAGVSCLVSYCLSYTSSFRPLTLVV